MDAVDRTAPLARRDGLVVQELSDEVLVYDLERHRAHSLNRTAAWLWRHCDGQTSVAEMAARWHQELDLPPDEELVSLALDRLARTHLLEGRFARLAAVPNPSRRALMRSLAVAGGLGLVTSIVAPGAYAQAGISLPNCVCPGGTNCNCSSFPTSTHCCQCIDCSISKIGCGCPGTCVADCGNNRDRGCNDLCGGSANVKCCNGVSPGQQATCPCGV